MGTLQPPGSASAARGARDGLPIATGPNPSRSTLVGIAMGLVSAAALLVGTGGRPVFAAFLGMLLALVIVQSPLLGLLMVIPTQVNWAIGNIAPGGIAALAPAKVLLGLTLLGWLIGALRSRRPITWAPHMAPLALFAAIVLLAPWLTPAFDDSMVGVGKYLLIFVVYLLVANLAIDRRAVLWVCIAISVTACGSALLALIECFLPGIPLTFDGTVGLGAHLDTESLGHGLSIARVTGGLGDANWFSYTMATCLPLAYYWMTQYRQTWVRALGFVMALLLCFGIVFAYTRTPFIGLAGAMALLVFKRRLPVRPLLLAGALILVTAPIWLPDGFVERFTSTRYLKEGSTPMRTEVYEMAALLIEERPILGYGYQRFGPEFVKHSSSDLSIEFERRDSLGQEALELLRAHNIYLDITVMHGLVGLLPLVAFFVMLLVDLNGVARAGPAPERELAIVLMACLLCFYLCGIGGHAQELKILWILAGLAAGLRRCAFERPPG